MRHNKKINHLGRTSSHRNAMLANMCISLIREKRIFTTVAKAKALRKVVEPIITKSKTDTTHSRRLVFQELGGGKYHETESGKKVSKNIVQDLFQEIGPKVADRPGGYTRIIKTGYRLGDNAAMCFIELVDFNENMQKAGKSAAKPKTRRSRKGGAASTADVATATEATEEKKAAPKAKAEPKKAAEAKAEKSAKAAAPKKEAKAEKAEEKKETPKKEEE